MEIPHSLWETFLLYGGKLKHTPNERHQSTFKRGWMTAGHSDLWDCEGTYCLIPYDQLPLINRASDDLTWLDEERTGPEDGITTLACDENEISGLENIVEEAKTSGLILPTSFLRLLRSAQIQERVPTCTACYLSLSDQLVPLPGEEGHFLLRFLNDQQCCCLWYLCLSQNQEPCVIVSSYFIEPEIFAAMEYEEVSRDELMSECWLCAETFSEFLYRFWIENSLWFSIHKKMPLTLRQETYKDQVKILRAKN